MNTAQSECSCSVNVSDTGPLVISRLVISDFDEIEVAGYDTLHSFKIDHYMRYLQEHIATLKWAEGTPQPEERMYPGSLNDAYKNIYQDWPDNSNHKQNCKIIYQR